MNMKKININNEEIQLESDPIKLTDSIGREKFWEDLGRKDD